MHLRDAPSANTVIESKRIIPLRKVGKAHRIGWRISELCDRGIPKLENHGKRRLGEGRGSRPKFCRHKQGLNWKDDRAIRRCRDLVFKKGGRCLKNSYPNRLRNNVGGSYSCRRGERHLVIPAIGWPRLQR